MKPTVYHTLPTAPADIDAALQALEARQKSRLADWRASHGLPSHCAQVRLDALHDSAQDFEHRAFAGEFTPPRPEPVETQEHVRPEALSAWTHLAWLALTVLLGVGAVWAASWHRWAWAILLAAIAYACGCMADRAEGL